MPIGVIGAALIGSAISAAIKGAEAGFFSRKSRMERMDEGRPAKYRTDRFGNREQVRPATGIYAEADRLSRGGGGFTPSQRTQMEAQGVGQVQAQQQQAQAQAARAAGAMGGYGAMTGQHQQAMAGIQQAGQGAVAQVRSQVRDADLQKAVADRALLQQRMQAAMTRGQQRRAFGYQAYTSPSPTDSFAQVAGQAFGQGQAKRGTAAQNVDQSYDVGE